MDIVCHSEEEMLAFSSEFGKTLEEGDVVCFFGDLGAGKTTFIKGLALASAQIPVKEVCSPTFVYLNVYEGSKTIYHFDLYRLSRAQDFLSAGFDEFLDAGGICCIEWSEKIHNLIPEGAILVYLSYLGENVRQVKIERKTD